MEDANMQRFRWLDPRRSFATRVTLVIVSLILLTLAGATLVTLRVARTNLTEQAGHAFEGHAESLSELVQLYLTSNVSELQQLAAVNQLDQAAADRNASYSGDDASILVQLLALDEQWRTAADDDPLIRSVVLVGGEHERDPVKHAMTDPGSHSLAEFLDLFEEHSEVFLTDRYGGTISATGRLSDYYQADEDWWQAAWNDGAGAVYISDPEFDESAGVTALLIAVPVIDDGGTLVGILRSTLNVNELFGLLSAATLGDTGYAALLKADGTPLFDPGADTAMAINALPDDMRARLTSPDMNSIVGAGTILGHEPLSPLGNSHIGTAAEGAALAAVEELGWHIVFRQDTGEALSTLNLIERVAWIVGAVSVLIGTLVAAVIAQAVTRPLTKLAAAARQIGAGNLDVDLPDSSGAEIGGLTSAFRAMSERLQEMIGTLQARTDELSQANVSLTQEIDERKHAEEARQLYVSLAENSSDFVGMATLDGQITFVNKAGLELVGLDGLEDAQSRTMFEFLMDADLPTFKQELLPEIMQSGQWQGEFRLRHFRTGAAIPIDMNTFTIDNAKTGEPIGLATVSRDITERKQTEEALEGALEAEHERARHDSLTDALNHGAITQVLRDLCSSEKDGPLAVAMIDLDGLKAINDTYGHQIGDESLIIVANALSRQNAIVGRYGGDEFIVILPGADRAGAERYRDSVTATLLDVSLQDPETNAKIQIVASWGIAIFPEEAENIADLIHLSDNAMYAAKRQRPVSPNATTTSRPPPGDRAAAMVGQIVPLLTSVGNLTEKLQLVSRRLAVGAGYDAVNFTLFQEVTGQALSNTSYPPVPKEFVDRWDRAQQPDSESHPVTLLLAQTLRPLILDDPWNDERLWESERNLLRAAQLRSVLIAPMIWQGEMIGTIGVAAKQLAAFAAADAQFLSAIATQVTAIVRMETLVDKLSSTTTLLSHS